MCNDHAYITSGVSRLGKLAGLKARFLGIWEGGQTDIISVTSLG